MSAAAALLGRARRSWLFQRPQVVNARNWVAHQRDIRDSRAVRQFRQLVQLLKTNPPDILYLGDSISLWTHPDDQDARPLKTMIADELGPDVSMFTVWGASFGPHIHKCYLRALDVTDHRPLIINTLWARGCTTGWTEHPVFGHQRSIEAIEALDPTGPLRNLRLRLDPPPKEAWEAFYALPYPTLADPDGKIGDYAPKLRDLSRWAEDDPERLKLLYTYHYGASIEGTIGLPRYTELARAVRETGSEVVAYQNPVPVPWIEQIVGPEYGRLAKENFALLDEAYNAGHPDVDIIQSGLAMAEGEHLGIVDSSEHLNERGRHRLLDMIMPAIRRGLERRG